MTFEEFEAIVAGLDSLTNSAPTTEFSPNFCDG